MTLLSLDAFCDLNFDSGKSCPIQGASERYYYDKNTGACEVNWVFVQSI